MNILSQTSSGESVPDGVKANYFSCYVSLMWLLCFLLQTRVQSCLGWITYLAETGRGSARMTVSEEQQSDSLHAVCRNNPSHCSVKIWNKNMKVMKQK